MIKNKILAVFLLMTMHLMAQEYPKTQFNPERLADELFPMQDMDLDYAELYENLTQLLAHPIDLNKASLEQLRNLFILNEAQMKELLDYREQNGPLLSVYELQSLPSLDPATLYKLIPFVEVKDEATQLNRQLLKRIIDEENNFVVVRYARTLEARQGDRQETDSASRYAGSPENYYLRFRISHPGDFSIGFTMEKDAGERFNFRPSQRKYGFDYYSIHSQVINKGKIQNLIVGDYQAQFGQGLTLGGGFGMGKGSETITTIRRSTLGFLPYASLSEAGFFRGSAISFRVMRFITLHAFGSYLGRDTNVKGENEDELFTSSFISTGLHRTPGEILSRKQIGETNYGAVIHFKQKAVDAGLIYHHTDFSVPLLRTPTLYNQFSFNGGGENDNAGGFFNLTTHNITFFSEFSKSIRHGKALIAGLLGSVTKQFDFSLLYRKYDRDFFSFYSNAVSESTLPQNESGIYWGWKYAFSKRYSLAGYADFFRFPWLRYRGYAPSDGSEWLLRFNYQPSRQTLLFLQVREENKIRNGNVDATTYQTFTGIKRNYSINADYEANKTLRFKTRLQFSTYTTTGTTHGVTLIQDVSFDVSRKLSLSARYALFDTDDYDNRQYAYERDVWLAYSFPAYYGTGIRHYLLAHYRLSKKTSVWIRWARTTYTNTDSIGSGSEQIDGNQRNEVKFQLSTRL